MVINRPSALSTDVEKYKLGFDKVVKISKKNSDRTPLQLLVIASYLNRLDFIDHVNRMVTWDEEQWKFSPGILAQLLVLAPFIPYRQKISLYAMSSAYCGMDLKLLVGSPIDPSDLNDDMFGRLLDRIYECGCENLFYEVAMSVRTVFSLPKNYILHSDTTSHILYGDYSFQEDEKNPPLRITFGYSKDNRNDLKQIMTGMVTDGDGLVVYSKTLDGNTADCDYNNQMIKTLHTVYGPEFEDYVYIADSKVVNEPNIMELIKDGNQIPFISRLPQNFHKKLCEKVKTKAYQLNQWESLGTCCNNPPDKDSPVYEATMIPALVFGKEMYAHVFRTTEKREKIERKVEREGDKLILEVSHLGGREFYCEADALAEMNAFLRVHTSLMVDVDLAVIPEVTLKRARGRPGKNPKPPQEITMWKIVSNGMRRKEDVISDKIEKASTFCLLTNIDPSEKTSKDILMLYKGQSQVERQFSILKEPLVAATIFLELPERIKALMTMLYFSVLMHGILRVISHIELSKEANPPKLGHEKRPLIRPTSDTLIWILDVYTAVFSRKTITIESKDSKRVKFLPLILKIVRFDPKFL